MLYELKKKQRELKTVGLVFHIRNLCKHSNAKALGIKKECGRVLLKLKTGHKIWEFNFTRYREGCQILKKYPLLKSGFVRKQLHEQYLEEIIRWENKLDQSIKEKNDDKKNGIKNQS